MCLGFFVFVFVFFFGGGGGGAPIVSLISMFCLHYLVADAGLPGAA